MGDSGCLIWYTSFFLISLCSPKDAGIVVVQVAHIIIDRETAETRVVLSWTAVATWLELNPGSVRVVSNHFLVRQTYIPFAP